LTGVVVLRSALRTGGTVAIVTQPRNADATDADTRAAADATTELLGAAGFVDMRCRTLDLDPPVVCALAIKP
jgi:hypothetical protein